MSLTIRTHRSSFSVFNGDNLVCIVDHDYVPAKDGEKDHYLHHWNVGNDLFTTKVDCDVIDPALVRYLVLEDIKAELARRTQ